jgi:hypothetical protein
MAMMRDAKDVRSRRGPALGAALALAMVLSACQIPLGQVGFDNTNTSSNANETTLNASNVSTIVAKFDLNLSAYGVGGDLGEPVLAGNGNVIVIANNDVISVTPAGAIAWRKTIADPKPSINAPHLLSAYGGESTVDVVVDAKAQGAAPGYVGGSIVKLDNATGAVTATEATFRPAAPIGYANDGLVVTGLVVNHASYGAGRTVTIDVAGSGRRIIRNAEGDVQKPAVAGDQLVVAVGDTIYRWSAPCATGTVCNESTAAKTNVPIATRPVLVGTTVYVTGAEGRTFYAIGPNGAVLWTANPGNFPGTVSTSSAAGMAFVGNVNGQLFGFPLDGCGAATCAYRYVNVLGGGARSAPTLANGLAYLMADQTLKVIRTDCKLTEDCPAKKSISLSGSIGGSSRQILVKDGRIHVLTNDGHLRSWGL